MYFQLHFGSRVRYDAGSGQWSPLEDELGVPEDLPVLQRMKVCLDQVTPWPPSVEVVQMVAAQCGVTAVKRRIRLPHSSSPEATSAPI
ncbi:hypothetical protein ASF71_18005 [Deinococcus sp. Leaf326]|nr:hypothetical protein ASF71_18005 [Deinococcus sp. Leaf326]